MIDPILVKIGGSTLGEHDTTLEDLVALQKEGVPVVVVHGGGKVISDWQSRMGLQARFVRGLRVTDAEGLSVVMATLAGLVNKDLVARLSALGGRAWGLSGIDDGLLRARVRDPELGYVGEVTQVNAEPVRLLLQSGYLPVIAPLGLGDTPLNLNADTAAAALASALRARQALFLTDVAGVAGADGKTVSRLSAARARALVAEGVITGGMIPKVEACLAALDGCPEAGILDGRQPHALRTALVGPVVGTTFHRE